MPTWPQFTARFGAKPDRLGFATGATPSADEWLTAFTDNVLRYRDAAHGAQALLLGLRFSPAAPVAEIAALPPARSHQHPVAADIPHAVNAATVPIIAGVYEQLISRGAGRAAIQAAFGRETPTLVACYQLAGA